MFREGHYLEIIRASENCVATAIVTVNEKIVEINKKKVATNKWLNVEDWSKLYKILQRAILRNSTVSRDKDVLQKTRERKKTTSRLDIVYAFKPCDDPTDATSLPTIKVRVSPIKRKSSREIIDKTEINNEKENGKNTTSIPSIISYNSPEMKLQRLLEGIESSPEEYVPSELPHRNKYRDDLKYVPSRKSFLKRMRQLPSSNSNEYTPISGAKGNCSSLCQTECNIASYIPNSVSKLQESLDEKYDPCSMSNVDSTLSDAYVPSTKGSSTPIEEYEPDFATKMMKFDNSYVPSCKRPVKISKNENIVKKKIRRERETKKQMRSISKKSLINSSTKLQLL